MWTMMPKIEKITIDNPPAAVFWSPSWGKVAYKVTSKNSIDLVGSFSLAIRYWLWHCGVPAKIVFWRVKRKE